MVSSNGSSPLRPPARGPITVHIVGARGLRSADWPKASDPCCYCEIPGKPRSRFQTKVVENSLSPSWDREQEIEDYAVGDALVFSVYDQHAEEPGQLLPLGKATLESEIFHPDGFEGELRLLGEEAATEAYVKVRVERASEDLRKSGRALDCIEVLGGIALAGLAQDNLDDTGGSLVTKAPSNDMSELASGCGGIDSESPDGEERHCFSTTEAHEPYRGEIGVFEARPGEVLDRIVEAPGREDGSPERKPVDDSAKTRTIPMRALFFDGPAEQIEPPAEHVSEEPLPEGEVVHVVTEVKSEKSSYGVNPFGDEEEAAADGASRARSMTQAADSLEGEPLESEVNPDREARPSGKVREFSGDYLLPRMEIGGNRKDTDAGPLEPREDTDAVEDAPRASIVPGQRPSIEPGQRGSIVSGSDARGSLPRDFSGDYLLPRQEIGGNRKDTDAGALDPQKEASPLSEDSQRAGGVTALPQPGDLEPVVSATRTGDGVDDYPSSDIYPASEAEGAATQPGANTPDQPLSAVATVDGDTPYAKESVLGGSGIFDWSGAELKKAEPCGLDSLSELDLLSPKSNRQAAVLEEKAAEKSDGDGEPDVIATLSETISAEAVEKGVRAAVASVSRDEDGPTAAGNGKEPGDPVATAMGVVHVSEGSATTVSVAPVEEAEAVEEEEDEQPPVLARSSTSRASGAWSSPTASPKSTRSGAPRVLLGGVVPEEEEQGVVAQEAPNTAAPRAISEVTVAPDTPPGAVTNLLDLSPVRERPPASAEAPVAGEEETCPKGLGRLSRAGFAVPGDGRSPEKEAPESPLLPISPSGTASVPGASLVPSADAAATGTPKAQAASPKEARQDLTAPLLDLGDLGEVMAESRHRFNAGPLANENRSLLDITPAVSPGVKDIPEEGTITRSSSSSEVRAPASVERPPDLVLPELTKEQSPKNSSAPKSPVPPVWMEGLRPPKPLLDVEPISPCTNPDPDRERRSSDQRMGARGLLEMEPFSPADGTKSRESKREEPDPPVAVETVPLIMVHPPVDAAKNPDYRSPRKDGEAPLPEAGRESMGSRNGPLFMSSEGADSLVPQTEEEERDSGRTKEEGKAVGSSLSLGGGDASGGPENPGARSADAPAAKKASEPAEVAAAAPPAAPAAVTTEKDKMMEQMMEEFRRMKEEMSQQLQAAQRLNEEKDEQVRKLQERLSQEEEVRQTLSTQMAQQQVQLRQLEARREAPGSGGGSAFPPATSARAESKRSQSPGSGSKLGSSLRGLSEGGWSQKPPSRAAALKEHAASDRKTHHHPSPPKEQPASRDEQKPLFDDSDEEDRMSVESGPKGEGCLCMSR